MHTVEITDPLYDRIQERAAAYGVTAERYIEQSLALILREDEEIGAESLTATQLEIVNRARAEIKAGKFFTMEQVRERLSANRAAWKSEPTAS